MSAIDKVRRLLHLVERLQSGRTYNARELAEFCEVSRRTTFRDIKSLQDAGIPVLYDSEKQGYWMAVESSLPPTDLTLQETLALMILAQELGSADRGVPFQETARDAALKLQSNLPGDLRNYVGEYTGAIHIRTEPQTELSNRKVHFQRFQKAITERKKIRIEYDSLHETRVINTLVSPYRLLFLRHSWYAIGRSSLHRAVRTFNLRRVLSSEITEDDFDMPPRFSLKRYFGHAWNMIRERRERTRVHIRFQSLVATNVAEVTWHRSQELKWNDDGTLDYFVTVDGIKEISWWVLGYGNKAEVIAPESLRDLLREHVQSMAALYEAKG